MLGLLLLCVGANAQKTNDPYKLCDESKLYSPDQPMLAKFYKGKVPVPKTTPQWPKGLDSLQSFYNKHLAHFTLDKATPIQRVILTFNVDCNGNPGDFQFMNKENYPIQDAILSASSGWMEKWTAATHKGKNVDCRVIIIFSIANQKVKVRWKED